MNRIGIAALMTVMICISGCGPAESQPTERQRFEATEKLLSAWDKDIKSSRADYIRVLISEGANVNAKDKNGRTPLMYAAFISSTPEIVQLLLEKGAELEARDTTGFTPLMFAAGKSSTPEIVELLIEKGAEVNARGPDGKTPLMFAAWNSLRLGPEIKQLLIDAGATE